MVATLPRQSPSVASLFERLFLLASADQVLVVVDRSNRAADRGHQPGAWRTAFARLTASRGATAVTITPGSHDLYDLDVWFGRGMEVHVSATRAEVDLLLERLVRRDSATLYVGEGAHAPELVERLSPVDLGIVIGVPQDDEMLLNTVDAALPLLELLATLRLRCWREAGSRASMA